MTRRCIKWEDRQTKRAASKWKPWRSLKDSDKSSRQSKRTRLQLSQCLSGKSSVRTCSISVETWKRIMKNWSPMWALESNNSNQEWTLSFKTAKICKTFTHSSRPCKGRDLQQIMAGTIANRLIAQWLFPETPMIWHMECIHLWLITWWVLQKFRDLGVATPASTHLLQNKKILFLKT